MVKNQKDISKLRKNKKSTVRPLSKGLEKILFKQIKVLDKGFIRVVDYMGNDDSIVQAARVSYGKGTKKKSEDKGLIRYLLRHKHTTPFEMCEIKLHVKLPIFIARQWIRHRTASINEYSARYSILEDEFYIPKKANLSAQNKTNKQGRGDKVDSSFGNKVIRTFKNDADRNYTNYTWMLNDKSSKTYDQDRIGLTRELARINLPLNTYTEWYWKTDLHNFMHFLHLRADYHSQYEIREYGNKLLKVLKSWVPVTYDAFISYKLEGSDLSKEAIQVVRKMISGKKVKFESSKLSKREWNELMDLIS